MIAKMLKTYVATRRRNQQELLEALRELGVVHITPVEPAKAVAHEQTVAQMDRLRRAQQLLADVTESDKKPHDVTAIQAADEALSLHREAAERRSKLAALHRQIDQIEVWGDVRLEQFAALRDAGVEVSFYTLPEDDAADIKADFVQVVAEGFGRGVLVAVVKRHTDPEIPQSAEPVELPERDRHDLRAEAAELDKEITADEQRMAELAHFAEELQPEINRLAEQAEFSIAERSGLVDGELYAVQGWVPVDKADGLASGLEAARIEAGVSMSEPTEEDEPPTLIRYPAWSRPIKGLFDILGTFPGYREFDLSAFFMIALPIFAGMLIGDAGYGLLFLLLPLLLRKKLVKAAGPDKVNLIMVFGAVTLLWGVLTANYFGLTPDSMASAAGYDSYAALSAATTQPAAGAAAPTGPWVGAANTMAALGLLWSDNPEHARAIIIMVSFLLGMLHLVLGHLRQAIGFFPSSKFLSEIGWAAVLVGMLGIIWLLFEQGMPEYFVTGGPSSRMMMTSYVLLGAGWRAGCPVRLPGRVDRQAAGLRLRQFAAAGAGHVRRHDELHSSDGRRAGELLHRLGVQRARCDGRRHQSDPLDRRSAGDRVRPCAEHRACGDRDFRTRRATEYVGVLKQCRRAMGRLPLRTFCDRTRQGELRDGCILRTVGIGVGTGLGRSGQRVGH